MSTTPPPPPPQHPHLIFFTFFILQIPFSISNFLADPVIPGSNNSPYFVPSVPLQTQSNNTCKLNLSAELFGGVKDACGHHTLDRSRCCPVLAAWLFAAHSSYALQLSNHSPESSTESDNDDMLPIVPDDSQNCVDSLQSSLLTRNIHIVQPNASCDAVLCFCGIRLHQISSLSCPAAFNVSNHRNATPTAAVRNLEKSCRNSSYSGCTKCLGALQKVSLSF